MRLHRVEIRNFRRHEHLALDLCDGGGEPRPLTVLVGPNMAGKTTVLDAVHLVYEAVRNQKSPSWRPGFDPSDPTLRPNPNEPVEVTVQWSLHEGEWEAMAQIEKALQGTLRVENAPLYEMRLRWPGSAGEAVLDIPSSKPANASLAFRGRALTSLALHRRVSAEDVLDRLGGVLYLDQNRRGTISSADERLDFARDALPGSPMPDVIGWLARASTQHLKWDEATRGESQWNRTRRLFRSLAAPAQLDDAVPYDEGYDLRFRRGDTTYFAAGTSSGERQLLRLAANMAFFRARRSLIMIDELELNLHPRWQRSLLQFCKTGGDDENQFVVTTHSDAILEFADPTTVITLGVPEGGFA